MAYATDILAQLGTTVASATLALQQMPAELPAPTLWQPPAASTTAYTVDIVWDFINWLFYIFFALVFVLMVVFVVRYRHRRGTPYRTDYPHHNTPLELAWTIIPTFIVIGLFWFGFKEYLDASTPPKNTYDIQVTAQKWAWNFTYPNGAQSSDQQLYIPANKPIRLVMRSSDVLHSLFIPDFRVKKDVVPGRYTQVWFETPYITGGPDKNQPDVMAGPGFNLFCTEYCGTGHSNMNRKVYVLAQDQFDEWVKGQAEWLDKIGDENLITEAGPRLFVRCAQCHTLDGTPGIGPTWKGLVERVQAYPNVGPGKQYETVEDYIKASILNPGEYVVPTFANAMPTFKGQIGDRGIDALVGYMKNLDKFDPKTGKLLEGQTGSKP